MWFKNLLIYRLTQDLPVDAEALEANDESRLRAVPNSSRWKVPSSPSSSSENADSWEAMVDIETADRLSPASE